MSTSVAVLDHPGSVRAATWGSLGGAEAGVAAYFGDKPDRTVQVSGTFGSATVILQGSNDGSTWFPLTKPGATAISFTAAGGCAIVETPLYLRPSSSGGTASALSIVVSGR